MNKVELAKHYAASFGGTMDEYGIPLALKQEFIVRNAQEAYPGVIDDDLLCSCILYSINNPFQKDSFTDSLEALFGIEVMKGVGCISINEITPQLLFADMINTAVILDTAAVIGKWASFSATSFNRTKYGTKWEWYRRVLKIPDDINLSKIDIILLAPYKDDSHQMIPNAFNHIRYIVKEGYEKHRENVLRRMSQI